MILAVISTVQLKYKQIIFQVMPLSHQGSKAEMISVGKTVAAVSMFTCTQSQVGFRPCIFNVLRSLSMRRVRP